MAKSAFGKLISCPVCKKNYLTEGLKNHIINSAKGEVFKTFNNLLDASKMKSYNFSPRVLLNQTPHLVFYRKNLKNKTTFQF